MHSGASLVFHNAGEEDEHPGWKGPAEQMGTFNMCTAWKPTKFCSDTRWFFFFFATNSSIENFDLEAFI